MGTLESAIASISDALSDKKKSALSECAKEDKKAQMTDISMNLKKIFRTYYELVEGYDNADRKAEFTVSRMQDAAESESCFTLRETYMEYRKRIGKLAWMPDLPDMSIARWCPESIETTDEAFDALSRLEDSHLSAEFLREKQNQMLDKNADKASKVAAIKKKMFNDAEVCRLNEEVATYAKRFGNADFEIRDIDGNLIGFYNSNVKSCSRKKVIRIGSKNDDGKVVHAVLFVK